GRAGRVRRPMSLPSLRSRTMPLSRTVRRALLSLVALEALVLCIGSSLTPAQEIEGGEDRSRASDAPSDPTLAAFLRAGEIEKQPLFSDERFPNIVVALDGTVVATWGSRRIRVRRSEDGGVAWGDEILVAEPGFQGGGTTVDEK